jgi:hypothetical protein
VTIIPSSIRVGLELGSLFSHLLRNLPSATRALSLGKNLILFCTATKTKFRTLLIKEEGKSLVSEWNELRVRCAPRFALCAPPNNLRSHASSAASSGVSGLCARTYYMYVAVFALGALLLTRTHTRLDPGKPSYMCAVWCSSKIQCSLSLSW